MEKMKMKAAKMHYEALMQALAALGMSLAEFEDEMNSESEPESESYEEGEAGEEEEMKEKKPLDKGKVAIIVARMKKNMKE